jgi:hypothetical protein
MDFSLLSMSLAVWAIVAAIFFWEDSQADVLEKKRIARLNDLASFILKTAPAEADCSPEELAHWVTSSLTSMYDQYRHIIQPLKGIMPYKKILINLTPATLLSIIYGVGKDSISQYKIVALGMKTDVSEMLSIIVIMLFSVSLYLSVQEFIWVFKLKSQLENLKVLKDNIYNIGIPNVDNQKQVITQ